MEAGDYRGNTNLARLTSAVIVVTNKAVRFDASPARNLKRLEQLPQGLGLQWSVLQALIFHSHSEEEIS